MIAGIDPGTTAGWALLDLDGSVILSGSGKEVDLNMLVEKLAQTKTIIAVGTDKAKVPSFVYSFATKIGARIFSPSKDLLVDEKRELVKNLKSKSNHEFDAIASAEFAFRKLKPLIQKTRLLLEKEEKLHLLAQVLRLVVKEKISIRSALEILEFKESKTKEIPKQPNEVKESNDFSIILNSLANLRRQNKILEASRNSLENENEMLKQENLKIRNLNSKMVIPKSKSQLLMQKDQQIQSLLDRLTHSKEEILSQKQVQKKLEQLIMNNEHDKIPRIKSKNGISSINSEIIFIDSTLSENELTSALKKKGLLMLSPKERCGKIAEALESSDYELFDSIVLVRKSAIKRIIENKTLLKKIVKEYQENRLSLS